MPPEVHVVCTSFNDTMALGIIVLGKCLPHDNKTDFIPITIQEVDKLIGKIVASFKENAKKHLKFMKN